MTVGAWADTYLVMIDDCEAREQRLSDWERNFIDSLKQQIEKGFSPSEKQIAVLDRVWDKATARG